MTREETAERLRKAYPKGERHPGDTLESFRYYTDSAAIVGEVNGDDSVRMVLRVNVSTAENVLASLLGEETAK